MAIDTNNKKLSLIGYQQPFNLALPISSDGLDQDDKQHLIWQYSGLLWESEVEDVIMYSNTKFQFIGKDLVSHDVVFIEGEYWMGIPDFHVKLNESSGDIAEDSGKYGCDLKLYNSPSWVSGKLGNALRLDGVDQYGEAVLHSVREATNPVLEEGVSGFDDNGVYHPYALVKTNGEINMYYSAVCSDGHIYTGLATTTDKKTLTKQGQVLDIGQGVWDNDRSHNVWVLLEGDTFKMWIDGQSTEPKARLGYAVSSDGLNFDKYAGNPILEGDVGEWDEITIGYPSVIEKDGTYYIWYSGMDSTLTRRGIGLAVGDGINLVKYENNPVIDMAGVYKGFVRYFNGYYWMLYQFNSKIYIAYSTDKINWTQVPNAVINVGASDEWDDYELQDAHWISLDEAGAFAYYTGKRSTTFWKIGLIELKNLTNWALSNYNLYPVSISFWIKTSDAGASKGILFNLDTSPYDGYLVYLSSGRLKFFYANSDSDYVDMYSADSLDGGIINNDAWRFIVITVDNSGGKIYVDNTLVNARPWTGTAGVCTSNQLLEIGRWNTGYIAADLDDLRIYNRILTEKERVYLYGE